MVEKEQETRQEEGRKGQKSVGCMRGQLWLKTSEILGKKKPTLTNPHPQLCAKLHKTFITQILVLAAFKARLILLCAKQKTGIRGKREKNNSSGKQIQIVFGRAKPKRQACNVVAEKAASHTNHFDRSWQPRTCTISLSWKVTQKKSIRSHKYDHLQPGRICFRHLSDGSPLMTPRTFAPLWREPSREGWIRPLHHCLSARNTNDFAVSNRAAILTNPANATAVPQN